MQHANTLITESTGNIAYRKYYPWLVWLLGATFFFYKYVLQVSPSVMTMDLMRSFTISGAGLGNLAACFSYTYLVMQIPVGLLLDRWSPRIITTFAIFICALGALLFANAHTIVAAGISRGLIGLGAAFAAVSCFKLASLWFPPRRFALVAGLSMTAAMLGAVGGEAPLSFLVTHFGWRQAMTYVAFPGFILMLLVFAIVRDRPAPMAEHKMATISFAMVFKQLKTILKSRQTWLLSVYSGLAFAPVSVFGGLWGVSFMERAHHLSPTAAAGAVAFIFIGFAIGCPITGWLSDWVQRRKIIMTSGSVIALITMILVLYLPHISLFTMQSLMFCFGLGASCFFLCFSMVREINPLFFAATVLGFMNTFDAICEAVTEPFIGKLLDLGWDGKMSQGARVFSLTDYHMALMALPIYLAIALFILFFIRETYCKQQD